MKRLYTLDDLTVRQTRRQLHNGQSVAHTHVVEFVRPLTPQEQQQFIRLIVSFYDVVHFSRRYGNGLITEPKIDFSTPTTATYTLYQQGATGAWKDLLFAMLTTFSHEVVGIATHDNNPVFAPMNEVAV
ncbi:MAG: hypothetical protein R3C14_50735 [Caldilineaceae bacterium]